MSKARGSESRGREGACGGRRVQGSKRNGKCAKGRGDVGAGGGECEEECHVEASAQLRELRVTGPAAFTSTRSTSCRRFTTRFLLASDAPVARRDVVRKTSALNLVPTNPGRGLGAVSKESSPRAWEKVSL